MMDLSPVKKSKKIIIMGYDGITGKTENISPKKHKFKNYELWREESEKSTGHIDEDLLAIGKRKATSTSVKVEGSVSNKRRRLIRGGTSSDIEVLDSDSTDDDESHNSKQIQEEYKVAVAEQVEKQIENNENKIFATVAKNDANTTLENENAKTTNNLICTFEDFSKENHKVENDEDNKENEKENNDPIEYILSNNETKENDKVVNTETSYSENINKPNSANLTKNKDIDIKKINESNKDLNKEPTNQNTSVLEKSEEKEFLLHPGNKSFQEIDHSEIELSVNQNDHFSDFIEDTFEDVSDSIKEEMDLFSNAFPKLAMKYKLINKIGEGTFSTVYKARPLFYLPAQTANKKGFEKPPKQSLVALKRIYVTSSPGRIYNELSLLNTLSGCHNVAPLLDGIRHEDQVIAVLPYYDHADFRDFYRDIPLSGIKFYMQELLKGIKFVHSKGIIHRDIKPTNFLYNPFTRHGVLVDFGLAEKDVGPDSHANCCSCVYGGTQNTTQYNTGFPKNGYLKDDQRPGRRANRAGTRGFRAPEVLLKCNNQTTKLDIWSAGVMLLTLLCRRFPFFNSTDDIDALMEISNIFGTEEMKKCAKLHGLGFEIPIKLDGHTLSEMVTFCVSVDAREGDTFAPDSPAWEVLQAFDKKGHIVDTPLGNEYKEALQLLEGCLKLNFNERVTATNALKLDFFKDVQGKP